MIDNMQNQPSIPFLQQLTAINERLQSSLQAHTEAVKVVSDSLVKHNRIENVLNLIHELNLHSLDDISTKGTETIPSFVIDLLKMNTMTEDMYQSIQESEVTADILDKSNDDLNKVITMHQLSFPQIHKIQTQLLTPKLIGMILLCIHILIKVILDKLQSGHLSQQILDAYKSQSPLQIMKHVRTLTAQLNSLSFQRVPTISQLDNSVVSIKQQTTSKDTISSKNQIKKPDDSK